ncbi:MAG: NmrA family NAD(P)-binding protein [Acidimicrobiales bacterium]
MLILGGSGRTGYLIAKQLTDRGVGACTASRHGSDLHFDWDEPSTYADALDGGDRVYLVTPTMRIRYVDPVSKFLDLAEAAGVSHVTLLSTYNGDRAPQDVDVAAVEDQVANREGFTHTILRPAWVMQNFTDDHLPIVDGLLIVPSGGGAEAFVDALDIAEVAVETLLHPAEHAGAAYSLTGPEALTFDDVATTITAVSRRPVTYQDIDQEVWINGAIAAGVPADYAKMLKWLTGSIIAGQGSTPSGDVETVIGRSATSFEAFAQRSAAVWTAKEDK